jgi:hypothetical protein
VLRRECMGMGLIWIVIVDHCLIPTLSTSKILSQYLFEMGFKRETDGVSSQELWIYQGLFGFHRDSRGIDWGFTVLGFRRTWQLRESI